MLSRPHTHSVAAPIWSRELPLLLCGVLILAAQQLAIAQLGLTGAESVVRRGVFFLTTPVLFALALAFRRFLGAWVIAAGIVLNFIPAAAHGGLMPVSYSIVRESGILPGITEDQVGQQLSNGKDILLRREDIRFYELSDRFTLEAPIYGVNIYSLGDLVLFAGVAMVCAQAVGNGTVPGKRELDRAASSNSSDA